MADLKKKREQNVEGEFWVDSTCIDCDTCRWIAPDIFGRFDEMSAVQEQPRTGDGRRLSLEALLSCPTQSIGMSPPTKEIAEVRESFPLPITEDVYYNGFHDSKTYGASSYLIKSEEGNIMVDVPRFDPVLVESLEKMGGVSYLFLTHRDDVGEHQAFAEHFGCERILHASECQGELSDVERPFVGFRDQKFLSSGRIIPTPGHSEGSMCLLWKDTLFTGDHLAWSVRLGHLYAFRNYCWYDWEEQVRSLEKLKTYRFRRLLPGHGRRWEREDSDAMAEDLERCLSWARAEK